MGLEPGFKHWRLEIDASNIANLHLDKQGPGPNVLSSEVLGELDVIIGAMSESLPFKVRTMREVYYFGISVQKQ